MTSSHRRSNCEKHVPSLKCLITCTQWDLEIVDNTDEGCEVLIGTTSDQSIRFKHCTPQDQQDLLDDLIEQEKTPYCDKEFGFSPFSDIGVP